MFNTIAENRKSSQRGINTYKVANQFIGSSKNERDYFKSLSEVLTGFYVNVVSFHFKVVSQDSVLLYFSR